MYQPAPCSIGIDPLAPMAQAEVLSFEREQDFSLSGCDRGAGRPQVVLFDEPTASLDPEMVNEVLQTMENLADEGMTMLIVTHEMGFARRVADRVIFMDQRQIIEIAPPDDFFDRPQSARLQSFLRQLPT